MPQSNNAVHPSNTVTIQPTKNMQSIEGSSYNVHFVPIEGLTKDQITEIFTGNFEAIQPPKSSDQSTFPISKACLNKASVYAGYVFAAAAVPCVAGSSIALAAIGKCGLGISCAGGSLILCLGVGIGCYIIDKNSISPNAQNEELELPKYNELTYTTINVSDVKNIPNALKKVGYPENVKIIIDLGDGKSSTLICNRTDLLPQYSSELGTGVNPTQGRLTQQRTPEPESVVSASPPLERH